MKRVASWLKSNWNMNKSQCTTYSNCIYMSGVGVGVVASCPGILERRFLSMSLGRNGAPGPGGSGFWVPSGVTNFISSSESTMGDASRIIRCSLGGLAPSVSRICWNSSWPDKIPMISWTAE